MTEDPDDPGFVYDEFSFFDENCSEYGIDRPADLHVGVGPRRSPVAARCNPGRQRAIARTQALPRSLRRRARGRPTDGKENLTWPS